MRWRRGRRGSWRRKGLEIKEKKDEEGRNRKRRGEKSDGERVDKQFSHLWNNIINSVQVVNNTP